jgi:hypothetical protein
MEYLKEFERQAEEDFKAEGTADMSDKEYKEWAKDEAKELYGTDEIEVDDDGNVTVGTGDDAKTYTKA